MAYVPGDENPDPEPEFRKRGIAEWVWRGRPYIRYTREYNDAVRDAHASLAPDTLRWLMGIVNQSPGWMCVRHAPPGIALPDEEILPQLRPDREVRTGPPTIHHHPTVPSTGPMLNPYPGKNCGRTLPDWFTSTARAMERHINPKRRSPKPFDITTGRGASTISHDSVCLSARLASCPSRSTRPTRSAPATRRAA